MSGGARNMQTNGKRSNLFSTRTSQPSPHFSYSEINALPLNGQQAVTAISALWLRRSTAFRWLQQPIGRHLMIDVVKQVIERHQEVKNEGISEGVGIEMQIVGRFGT